MNTYEEVRDIIVTDEMKQELDVMKKIYEVFKIMNYIKQAIDMGLEREELDELIDLSAVDIVNVFVGDE